MGSRAYSKLILGVELEFVLSKQSHTFTRYDPKTGVPFELSDTVLQLGMRRPCMPGDKLPELLLITDTESRSELLARKQPHQDVESVITDRYGWLLSNWLEEKLPPADNMPLTLAEVPDNDWQGSRNGVFTRVVGMTVLDGDVSRVQGSCRELAKQADQLEVELERVFDARNWSPRLILCTYMC